MRQPTHRLIITFCSRDYIPVLANFVAALRKLKRRPLRVYCLDADTYDFCLSADVQARRVAWDGSLESLWTKRVEVFCDLMEDKHDFIHSDADAIWLRDPVDLWTSGDVDMSFSQGAIHPPDTHRALGFVLCCGFFRVNATAEDPMDTKGQVCAKHPLSAKNPRDKLNEFAEQGLLTVRPDWSDQPITAVFEDYFS